ncbi:MAG: class I SAM-dependent methyltransferase [Planctomycetes bacterium]|nr:class I SAM-dependent methyltransferase [Planctomycetota bacterium]
MSRFKLPFDVFQRYQTLGMALDAIRRSGERFRILDVGGRDRFAQKFLPDDEILVLDREPASDGSVDVVADITEQGIDADEFDFVVAVDVLEHIPAGLRLEVIERFVLAARRACILLTPCFAPEVVTAESIVSELAKARGDDKDRRWLDEHSGNGLPRREEWRARFSEMGWHHFERPCGSLAIWTALMTVRQALYAVPHGSRMLPIIDEMYNRFVFPHDLHEPAYRWLDVVSREPANLPETFLRPDPESSVSPADLQMQLDALLENVSTRYWLLDNNRFG